MTDDSERTNYKEHKRKIMFQHNDYPAEKFQIMHPVMVTGHADVLILPDNDFNEDQKQVAIPVNRSFIEIIPYFKTQFNEASKSRKTRNKENDIFEIRTPPEISAEVVFTYIKSVYDNNSDILTPDNCIEIFKLADHWKDDFMKDKSDIYIQKNLTSNICKVIYNDSDLHSHFTDVINRVFDHAFSKSNKTMGDAFLEVPDLNHFKLWNVPKEYRSYSSVYNDKSDSMLFTTYSDGTNSPPAWVPIAFKMEEKNKHENWLLFDFKKEVFINGVALQGVQGIQFKRNFYLERFKLKYWLKNEANSRYVDDGIEFINPCFKTGPKDYSKVMFKKPVKARYLKLLPNYWKINLHVRIGVFKCDTIENKSKVR